MLRHPLASDVVHAWRVSIADAPIADLAIILSADERERAARFVYDRDRNQFIAVRGWLRRLLGDYLQRPPEEIHFDHGPQGKPMLPARENAGNLRFNVSHSADVGVLAFSRSRDIGVDVELVERRFDIPDLARSCFSLTEQESLQSLAEDAQLERFFQLWTAKEAYIKALGGGLSIPLQDFSIDVRPDSDAWAITTSGRIDDPPLLARRIAVPSGYAGAVAAGGSDWTVDMADL